MTAVEQYNTDAYKGQRTVLFTKLMAPPRQTRAHVSGTGLSLHSPASFDTVFG